jgi:hypothetical protein
VDILRTCYVITRSSGKLEIAAKASYFDKISPPWIVEPGKITCEEFFKLMKKRRNDLWTRSFRWRHSK